MVTVSTDDWIEQDVDETEQQPLTSTKTWDELTAEIDDIVSGIQDTEEDNPYYKVAVYGRQGVGKSWFAASFPNCLIIDTKEDGTKFIPNRFGAKVRKAHRVRDIELLYWYLKNDRNHPFKSVAIDTTTSMAEMILNFVLKENEDAGLSPDPKLASMRDYQKLSRIMGLLLDRFSSLPMNVVFLAGERVQQVEEELSSFDEAGSLEDMAVPSIFPELPRALRSKLFRLVDIMGRLTTRDVTGQNKEGKEVTTTLRQLHTHTNGVFEAKDRTNSLPKAMTSPTYKRIEDFRQKRKG